LFGMIDAPQDCFVCRAFRAFAFSGLGAMLGGYGALLPGAGRADASLWAFGGALAGIAVMRRMRGNTKQWP
jgi:hypothetical protein